MTIELVQEHVAYAATENPWVKLYFDEVRFPDGSVGRYNRVVEGSGKEGVAILPHCAGTVALLSIDRYPVSRRCLEIPRGFGEGDSPVEDAHRELLEETGWRPTVLHDLGLVYPNSGLLSGSVRLFFAEVASFEPSVRDAEADSIAVYPVSALLDMARTGDSIRDVFTLSALLRADLRGLLVH